MIAPLGSWILRMLRLGFLSVSSQDMRCLPHCLETEIPILDTWYSDEDQEAYKIQHLPGSITKDERLIPGRTIAQTLWLCAACQYFLG